MFKKIAFALILLNLIVYGALGYSTCCQQLSSRAKAPVVIKETQPATVASEVLSSPTQPISGTFAVAKLNRNSYTVALFGDSMIDTMGSLGNLKNLLETKYRGTTFTLDNYGIGGENIEVGLARFDKAYVKEKRVYPAISALHLDVIILGSFAYNPFSPHDKKRYRAGIQALITKAKAVTPQTHLLMEIAPLGAGFGKGPNGVNWGEDEAHLHAVHIEEQLEIAKEVAAKNSVPVINVYVPSQQADGFGNPIYVNKGDGIHPSVEGNSLTIKIISQTLELK